MKNMIFFLLSFQALADTSCPKEFSLMRLQGNMSFCVSAEGDMVSKNCYTDKKCLWLDEVQKMKKINLTESDLVGGKNPLSKKCDKADNEIEIFRDEDGNEQTYCEIFRGKYVSTSSLE